MTRRRSAALVAVGVTVVAFALLVPSTSGKGTDMDEGSVVAYASRVLDGALPHRDFLTFYGPANPVLVAGAFAAFDESVAVERAVGLFYRLVIVLSLFALALRLGGLLTAGLAAVVSAWMMSNEIVWAYATYGSIAFGVLGLLLAAMGADSDTRRRTEFLYLAFGLACGMAILMRFDFALAALASAFPMLTLVPWRIRAWYVGGLVASAGLYVPHLLLVGWNRVGRLAGDLAATGPQRRLPILEVDDELGVLLAGGIVASVGYVALGAVLWRRGGSDVDSRLLTSVGLFCCGLVPWALFRADGLHVGPFAVVPLSLLPATALLLVSRSRVGPRGRLAASVVVALVALFPVVDDRDAKLGPARDLRGIRTAYRGFYDDDSRGAKVVVDEVARLGQPGDSLFVGPRDLRRADYGPTYMYFLLRDLQPASYYMEMNPGTANREGSGLADELRRANWLILTTEFESRTTAAAPLGPSEPNEVVRDLFCPRLEVDQYALYERCPTTR